MELLITDVTEMGSRVLCVAGWCAASIAMVRPLPDRGNWTFDLLEAHGIAPGAFIRMAVAASRSTGAFPHSTEDCPIVRATIQHVERGGEPWFGRMAPPTCKTMSDAFEGHVEHNWAWRRSLAGAHVKMGARTRSLWGIQVPRRGIKFFEEFDKLRARVYDGVNSYKLPVSSHSLKAIWREAGLAGVNDALPTQGLLHLRVGLARAYGADADKCYVMVNGIHW